MAEGRNRAYDPPGADPLQGTPLAHAEMNALAVARQDWDLGTCTLWSTQQPCSICEAACDFTGVGTVRFMAADPAFVGNPSGSGATAIGPEGSPWVVTGNLLLLHNIVWLRAPESSVIRENRVLEPETTDLVRVVEDHTLIDAMSKGRQFATVLGEMRNDVRDAAERREARRRRETTT